MIEAPQHTPEDVLVVEDDGMHRLVFGAYLRGMAHAVVFSASGEEAWAKLHERAFALVLMDVDLPDVDGLEITRRLRKVEEAQPSRPRTPVVALTAYGGANDVRRALAAGCDGYLVKPVTRDLLREAVSRFATTTDPASAAPTADPTPELRSELVASALQIVSQLRAALALGRRDEIRRLGHKLRGSAGTFGLDQVGSIAGDIESQALGAEMGSLALAIDRLATALEGASAPPSSDGLG